MDFRILGPLEVRDGDRELSLGGRQQRALLALLLLHANEVVPVNQIVDELWPEAPPTSATKSLQALVSRLRRTLEGEPSARNGDAEDNGVVLTRAHGYVLTVAPGELDRDRFESLLGAGRRALAAGHAKEASATLREALALWRGPPLAEFAHDSFAQVEIARLDELRLSALEERIEADLAAGRSAEVVAEVQALVAAHPLRERLRGQLMLALYRSGRQAEALSAYQEARRLLVDQLGIEPSQALQRLERAILQQEESLEPPTATVAVSKRTPGGSWWRAPLARPRRSVLSVAGALLLGAAVVAALVAWQRDASPAFQVDSNGVAVMDSSTNRLVGQFTVGARPDFIAYDAAHHALWVANLDDNSISRVEPRTRQLVRTIRTDASPSGLALGAGSLWVANGDAASVSRIDPRYNRVAQTIPIPGPSGYSVTAIAFGLGSVWVAQAGGTVSRIDPATGAVGDPIIVGNEPSALAVGSEAVWAANGWDGTVSRIDPTNIVTQEIPVGRGVSAVAVGADAVWVANALEDTVQRIDPDTNAVMATIRVPKRPGGIVAGAGMVWVTGSGDGTVSKIDPRTNEVVETREVGNSPVGVEASNGKLWVTVQNSVPVGPREHASTRGGVARVNIESAFDSTDPALAYYWTSWQIEYATCAKLLNYPDRPAPAGSQLVPEVAESLPAVSEHGRRYSFTIRNGYRFSPPSNEQVTARTFKYSIERSLSPELVHSPAAQFVADIVGVGAYRTRRAQHISGVVARGNKLAIELTHRAPDFPARLTMPFFCAVPIGTPVDPNGQQAIPSAGPYYVASAFPEQRIVLKPNPNYRGPRPHRLDGIVYTLGVAKARSVAQIEAGRADYVADGVPAAAAARLATRYGAHTAAAKADRQRYFTEPLLGVAYLALNTSRPLFADVRMRKAVNYAIDRPALLRQQDPSMVVYGEATDQYLPPGMPGYKDVRIYPLGGPDLGTARRLAAGRRGKAVLYTCNFARCLQQAQIIRTNLLAIGIDVEIKSFPYPVLNEKMATRGEPFDMAATGWVVDYADPVDVLENLFDGRRISADGNFNTAYFDEPAYNRKLTVAANLSGPQRYRAYGELDVELARDAAPLVAVATYAYRDFFSARTGCHVHQPVYGFDLAALCLR